MNQLKELFASYFLAPYAGEDIRIRKKAGILGPTTLVVAALTLVLSLIMAATGALMVAAILAASTAFSGIVLVLLAKKKYELASSLFLYMMLVAMFAAIKFDAYQNVYETYVFAALGLFFLLLVSLVGASVKHAVLASAGTIAGITVLYVADALPLDNRVVTMLAIQNLATCFILVIAGGFICAISIGMQNTLVSETKKASEHSQRQYETLSEAIAKANASAYEISRKLAEAAEGLSAGARQFRAAVSEETEGLSSLDRTLAGNAREEENVIRALDRVKASLDSYSAKVLSAGASITQMIESIGEIGSATSKRQEGVDALASLAGDGKKRVAQLSQSISTIIEATGRMDEVNSLIGDVAGRTNLLGMNASIEAAHAGAAGKGFAVVAQEIRTLSREAESGSQSIAAILTDTRKAVDGASQASSATNEFFGRMNEEIQRVAETLEELISRVRELSAGTAEVSGAIESFSGLAQATGSEANATVQSLRTAADTSKQARSVAGEMTKDAKAMLSSCDDLLAKAEEVRELGRRNIAEMETLKKTVDTMSAVNA